MNKMKHQDVKFLCENEAINAVNNPRFVSLEEFEDCYEVKSHLYLYTLSYILMTYNSLADLFFGGL